MDKYIFMLEDLPTYSPPEWVLRVRSHRPKMSDLPPVTVEELARHKEDGDAW